MIKMYDNIIKSTIKFKLGKRLLNTYLKNFKRFIF